MGTNFYVAGWQDTEHTDMDPAVHIGKRSAAGLYCWNCRITLCSGGEAMVHMGGPDGEFFGCCPVCGQGPTPETLDGSSVGRELGFNREPPTRKAGVRSCSSFSWAMEPGALEGVEAVEDEYGQHYSRAEFQGVLGECPIQFTDSIGRWFC